MSIRENIILFLNEQGMIAGFTKDPLTLPELYENVSTSGEFLGAAAKPVRLSQIHSEIIHKASEDINGSEGDGLYTDSQGIMLITSHADCIPVFLWSGKKIMLLHSGREGTFKGIAEHGVKLFDTGVSEIKAIIGPGICGKCYQVGTDIVQRFAEKFGISADTDRLDLKEIIKNRLIDCGIKEENISDCGLCTCHDNSFYSYRRNGTSLRNAAFFLRHSS